jgi:hypothetical protein
MCGNRMPVAAIKSRMDSYLVGKVFLNKTLTRNRLRPQQLPGLVAIGLNLRLQGI